MNTTVYTVDIDDWQGTEEELQDIDQSFFTAEVADYYWDIQIDDICWISDKETELNLSVGDIIQVGSTSYACSFKDYLKENEGYVFTLYAHPNKEYMVVSRTNSFYLDNNNVMYSFVSGKNSNQYTGVNYNEFRNDLNKSYDTWRDTDASIKENFDYFYDLKEQLEERRIEDTRSY